MVLNFISLYFRVCYLFVTREGYKPGAHKVSLFFFVLFLRSIVEQDDVRQVFLDHTVGISVMRNKGNNEWYATKSACL